MTTKGWIVLSWCLFVSGCSSGVLMSTRIGKSVAFDYARGSDFDRLAAQKAETAHVAAAVAEETERLNAQLSEVALRSEMALKACDGARVEQGERYSAQILGLRQQLSARGIRPRVVAP